MHQTFTCVLVLLGFSAAFGKYVYVDQTKTWYEARDYCRDHHTELAPVSSTRDIEFLRNLVPDSKYYDKYFWFGMKRGSTDSSKWFWSGGGEVTKFFWEDGQPDELSQDCGLLLNNKMHDATFDLDAHFFCYNVFVVKEKKTWEEAVDYCREHHHDLVSVSSEAEMTLIWRELGDDATDHVWIGLHFFTDDWLWTDGQPMEYEAWSEAGKPGCPKVKFECAALRMREPTNSTTIQPVMTVNVGGSAGGAEEVKEKVWEAHHCEEKLFFVCY